MSHVAPSPASAVSNSVQRLRLLAISLGLLFVTFAQNSGSTAADTKLDLIVDPARFLGRSLRLWDPNGSAGQLQDQAYGYLFPMGPFFLVGRLAQLPPWVIQRSWESAVLIAAFLGVVRLARLLDTDGFWPRVAAGLAYALAPRMLTELFSISSELLPVAVLPWVLIPLVHGSRTGSPRRAAAMSGVALLFAGGINASATLAILPVPALWLLTRSRGPRRAALMRWWALAVLLASLWWLIPLLVLGKYSPPFLDWIESSAVTTSQTSLIATLRGVDHWQAYLGPLVWPAGWVLVVTPAAIVATVVVAALGLAGMLGSSGRHRPFLVCSLLLGLVLLTQGHLSAVGPPFASGFQRFLDGPGNAFRNVHKFDPMVRLPLAIGLGQLLARGLPERLRLPGRRGLTLAWPKLLTAVAVLAVGAVAIGPVFGGQMVSQPRPSAEPAWWGQTADWLKTNAGGGRALVVPGAGRPDMVWGQTVDDPLQPVATSPWAVRDALPLAQPGYIRYLDSIEQVLARGEGSAILGPLLARGGVKYLLVRNDLQTSVAGATRLSYVHTTIANSPGLREVQHFGAEFGGSLDAGSLTDVGASSSSPAVQIYQVQAYTGVVGLLPADRTVAATGSGDALAALTERGVDADTPVVSGAAATSATLAGVTPTTVATDGIRRREVVFGTPGQDAATMTAEEPFAAPRAAHDYLPALVGPLSTVSFHGIASVRASSSGADADAALNRSPANGAFAAVDADAGTAWKSGDFTGAVGQWLEVTFAHATSPSHVRIAFATGLGDFPSRVRAQTDAGTVDSDVASDGVAQPLTVAVGTTRTLRITVLSMASGGKGVSAGISSLSIPGVQPTRTLDVPLSGTPDVLAFDAAAGYRAECLDVGGAGACDPGTAAAGEEDAALDRSFRLSQARSYRVAATVRLRPSSRLNAALDALTPITARASSTQNLDPRVRAGAVVDGDDATAWTAAVGDLQPKLTLTLPAATRMTGLTISTAASAPVSRPAKLSVRAAGRTWISSVADDGRIDFGTAVTAKTVSVTVLSAETRTTTDSVTLQTRALPIGIGEITVRETPTARVSRGSSITIGCQAGLVLQVDGHAMAMTASASVGDALNGRPILATPCGGDLVHLGSGAHRLRIAGTSLTAAESITATGDGVAPIAKATSGSGAAKVLGWGSTLRRVQVSTGQAAFLAVRENANAGWQATLNGVRLKSITLDGWQQGYLIPAGSAGTVQLRFGPQRLFTLGMAAGAAAVLALLAACWWRPRRKASVRTCPPELADASLPDPIARAIIVVAGFALLGWLGFVLAAVLLVGSTLAERRQLSLPPWWPAVLLGALGLLVGFLPPGSQHSASDSGLVQLGCGAVLLATAAGCLVRPRGASRSSRRSMPNQDSAATPVAASAVSTYSSTK